MRSTAFAGTQRRTACARGSLTLSLPRHGGTLTLEDGFTPFGQAGARRSGGTARRPRGGRVHGTRASLRNDESAWWRGGLVRSRDMLDGRSRRRYRRCGIAGVRGCRTSSSFSGDDWLYLRRLNC